MFEERFSRRKLPGRLAGGLFVANALLKGQELSKLPKKQDRQIESPKFIEELKVLASDPQIPVLLDRIKYQLDTLMKPTHAHILDPGYLLRSTYEGIKRNLKRFEQNNQITAAAGNTLKDEWGEYMWEAAGSPKTVGNPREKTIKALKAYHNYAFPAKTEMAKRPIKVNGFDRLPNWSDEKIKNIIKTLPPELFSMSEIIEFTNRAENLTTLKILATADANKEFNVDALAILGTVDNKINLYKGLEGYDDSEMEDVLVHEAGHHLDWDRSNRLNFKHRIEFFNEALELYRSYHKTKNIYPDEWVYDEYKVQAARDPNEFMFYLLTNQVSEYWADLVKKYVRSIKDYRRSPENVTMNSVGLSGEEYEFVEKWLKVQGVDFGYKV